MPVVVGFKPVDEIMPLLNLNSYVAHTLNADRTLARRLRPASEAESRPVPRPRHRGGFMRMNGRH